MSKIFKMVLGNGAVVHDDWATITRDNPFKSCVSSAIPFYSIKLPLTDKGFAAFGVSLMHCTAVIAQTLTCTVNHSAIYTLTSHPESMGAAAAQRQKIKTQQ